jgi:hypothetical protein
MCTGVRANISEFFLKPKGVDALRPMDEEGKIPGAQSFATKKAAVQKWGFKNQYDTVRILLDHLLNCNCNHCFCQSPGLHLQ